MKKKILLTWIIILIGAAFWRMPVFAEQKPEESLEILTEDPADMDILTEEGADPDEVLPFDPDVFLTEETELEAQNSTEEGFCEADSDSMLSQYLDRELLGEKPQAMKLRSGNLGDRLSEINRLVYTTLKQNAADIAAGEQSSTIVTIDMSGTSLYGQKWYAKDLGIESIGSIEDGKFVAADDFKAAFYEAVEYSMAQSMVSLLRDCPYEMFWFGKTYSSTVFYRIYKTPDDVLYATLPQNLKVSICASPDYAVRGEGEVRTLSYTDENGETVLYDPYTVDLTKIDTVNTAIDNARQIVSENSFTYDYETLYYYFSTVGDLSGYNSAAVSPARPYPGGYGDPWQIIYLFDGDPQTKVVCEGFAKGIQILCEMTEFKDDRISCYCVTGDLIHTKTGSNRGFHMWNIVHMDDGMNYMIDATNSKASDPWAFLAPYLEGTVTEGYVIDDRYTYIYDEEYTWLVYTKEDLTLAELPYCPARTPYDLTASVSDGSIILEWECDGTPAGYRISRSEDGINYYDVDEVKDASARTWTDEEAQNGVYFYRVTSFLELNGKEIESDFSEETGVCCLQAPMLKGVENTASAFRMEWTGNEKADGYKIYYCIGSGSFKWGKTIQPSSVQAWSGLRDKTKSGDLVKIKIVAYKEVGGKVWYSPYSAIKTVVRLQRPVITGISNRKAGIVLTWDQDKAADGYVIYRSAGGSAYARVKKITMNSRVSWTDSDAVKKGTKYSYKIISYKVVNGKTYLGYPSQVKSKTRK